MEHRREFKEEMEIVNESKDEESPEVQRSFLSDPSPQTRDVSLRGRGGEMAPPISASLGAMRPLVWKLDMLLLAPPPGCSSEIVKHKMKLLTEDVEEISYCLDTLSQLEDPPETAKCWMNEVRDLSYNMEDYIDSLNVRDPDHSLVADDIKITSPHRKWFPHVRTPKKHTLDEQIVGSVSEFRIYVGDAMKRHKMYGVKYFSTLRHTLVSVDHMLPTPTSYEETLEIVIDSRMNEFINSLANDGADQLQLKVVPILGSACLGKTTLATVLYNRIGLQFDCRAFIRVSKNNDMKKNFQDMLSQLERQQCPPQYSKEGDLINEIRNYLQDKRYLIIVDDVWSASVWDMIIRAFPKGSHGSRVITTTQIEDVAFRCCRYQPEQIFEMKPLDDRHSRKLFFNTLFGSESNCPEQFNKVSNEIIAICGGLPLATISIASLLASQPVITEDLLKHICESLSSLFSANPISERTRQALNLSFNNLPQYLKTCLLYVSMYQEGYTFCKNDLVKQWTAEGFIDATNGEDVEEVAESYLHQLISRRFIQPMRIDYNNEVLSCAVHDVVHDLITHKSAEENFIVAIDYSEKNVVLSHKARRLSILFGDARYAKAPAHIVESRARSLTFWGLFECMPRITEFKLLRVVNLQLSGYGGSKGPVRYNNPLDLSVISELSRMRYLKIVSHHCVKLPDYKGGLHCLETLDIMDAVVLKFGIGVYLPHLLHLYLSLRDDRSVQNWIDEMSDLDNLKHLQDLRLTFSSARSLSQEENMLVLWGFISRHNNLKTIVVACDSSDKVTGGASDTIISWDNMAPPPLLQRFEFSSHSSVIFSRIPKWVGKLGNLRILKISVRILEMNSVDILRGLHTLTSLSLSVSRETSKRIIFHKKAGFSVLRYIKLRFTTGISWIKFEENAMPNLLKLKLVFNAIPQIDHYEHGIITIDHMPALKEISVKFGAANQEYALRTLVRNHSRNPTINMPSPVEYSSYSNQSTKLKEQQDEIMEEEPDEYYKQQPDKIVEVEPDGSYKQPDKIVEKEQDGCTKTLERPAHERISNSSEPYSSVHVQAGAAVQRSVKHDPSETTWSCSRAIYLVEDVHSSPDEGSISNMVPASAPPAYVIRISGDYGLEQETRHPREYDPGWNEAYSFSLDELMSGTSNFSRENLLRDFSVANYLGKRSISVYKGYVHGDRIVAVKYPYTSSMKDYQAWQMGVDNYSRIYHPHLVQLIGFCSQYPHRILVYEYVPNGSLKHHLFKKHLASLAWLTRLKIAIGAAKGLSFLHDDADERMTFYRGFKASNILLDSDYEAKLWGLSLVKDSPQYDDTHRLAGEAAREQKDVYNFGVVLMQLMSGKQSVDTKRLYWKEDDVECSSSNPYSNSNPDSDRNSNSNPDMTCGPIPIVFPNLNSNTNPDCSEISNWNSTSKTVSKWSTDPRYSQKVKDKLHNIMDPRLEGQYSVSAARSALKIARRCLESMPEQRPPMRQVLDALEPLLSNDITDGQLLASGKPETMKTKLTQYFTSSKDKELAGGAVEVEQAREGEDEMFRSNRLTVVEENFDGSSVTVIRRVQDMDYQQQSAGNKAKWSRYLVGSKAKVAKRLSLKGRAKAERNNDWPRRGKKQQGELVVGGQQV